MTEKAIKGETHEEYVKDSKRFFGDIQGPKVMGPSADRRTQFGRHLPGPEQEWRLAERYAKGFGKASRSGAFSKPSTGFALRPSGGKFASDFVDEMTPGKYKPQPKAYEKVKHADGKGKDDSSGKAKPACIIVEKCMDCMEPIDYNEREHEPWPVHWRCPDCKRLVTVYNRGINYVANLGFVTQTNSHRLYAMGMLYGDPFISMFHATCMERVKHFSAHSSPLVHGGILLTEKEQAQLLKWKGILQIHDGREITTGQWLNIQRLDRLAEQTQDYIIEQRKIGNLDIFREDRK
jgi:hypothetical protein